MIRISDVRSLAVVAFIFLAMNVTFGQHPCGTKSSIADQEWLEQRLAGRMASSSLSDEFVDIPLAIHIIKRSDGSGGLSLNLLEEAMDRVNSFYSRAGMSFFVDTINIINNDIYYEFDSSFEEDLGFQYDVANTINIYFSDVLSAGGNPLCGYTYQPPSADRVFVANGCIIGGTFEHELGHYFTLYHTHGITNSGGTNELVDGTNCVNAGDFVCDTPADPNLSGLVNSQCQYTGDTQDANRQQYRPMVNNLMSYAPGACRDAFTLGQYGRIRTGFEVGRTYLDYELGEVKPVINFKLEACTESVIEFRNLTENSGQIEWTFEGGQPRTSTDESPLVYYANAGSFSVRAEVMSGPVTEVLDTVIQIISPTTGAIADSLQIQFTEEDFQKGIELDGTASFSQVTREEGTESGSVSFQQYLGTENGSILTPILDKSGVRGFIFSFDYSYSKRENVCDSLVVSFIDRCTGSEIVINEYSCDDLSTENQGGNELVIPKVWDTSKVSYEFKSTDELTKAYRLSLRSVSQGGNNLFVDNLKIEPDYSLSSPTLFSAQKEDGSIRYNWTDNSWNELGFVIQGSSDGVNFSNVDTTEINVRQWRLSADLLDLYTFFQIRALGAFSSVSDASNIVQLSPLGSYDHKRLMFYPNPAKSIVTVLSSSGRPYRITDLSGRVHKSGVLKMPEQKIDVRSLNKGVYFLQLGNDSVKLIKE